MKRIRFRKKLKTLNLRDIECNLDTWLKEKKITKEKDIYVIDLKKLGYDKLLGAGKLSKNVKITTDSISKKAMEKLKIKEVPK